MTKVAVIILKDDNLVGVERGTAERLCRYLLTDSNSDDLIVYEFDRDSKIYITDLLKYKDISFFVFIQGIVYLTPEGIRVLADIASKRKDISFLAPVCNESSIKEQRHSPPFLYQTITVFKWATEEIYKEFKDTLIETSRLDSFCLSFRREMLSDLPNELPLQDLHNFIREKRFNFGVAKGVYVHRYGNVYESSREDILKYVPVEAEKVLDIGCARGLFGEALKKRQRCKVTGIDIDPESLKIAKDRLDRVICSDIESAISKGELGLYDCIVCGDILEHLISPWEVVKALRNHLKKEGLFIASTPNINNWAIIYDILKGRWDYVPFSILSGTHIRFFTRQTFIELFEDAGYKIKEVFFQGFDIPPKGAEFIARLKENFPELNEEELKSSEILIVAGYNSKIL